MLEAFNRAQKGANGTRWLLEHRLFRRRDGVCFHIIGKPCIKYEHADNALMLAVDMKRGGGHPQLFTPQMQRSI